MNKVTSELEAQIMIAVISVLTNDKVLILIRESMQKNIFSRICPSSMQVDVLVIKGNTSGL